MTTAEQYAFLAQIRKECGLEREPEPEPIKVGRGREKGRAFPPGRIYKDRAPRPTQNPPREGEQPFGKWAYAEADRLGCSFSCVYERFHKGHYRDKVKVRRVNSRVVFITPISTRPKVRTEHEE